VVGVVESDGRRIVTHGPQAFDGDTVFEIGSITKVFTALLLADMVLRGEVAFSDPVAKWLPPHIRVPARNGRDMTLLDLASHTSGLPRMPSNFKPADPSNPYVDYRAEQLYQFLSSYELPRDIGSQVEYSNVGFGLLAHALALRAGLDYESLVRTRVLDPLGMRLTGVSLSPEMRARLAPGHNGKLERVGNWDLAVLAGAGALRSTANDMLTFLEATLGTIKSLLRAAMTTMLQLPDAKGRKSPIGWMVVTLDGVFSPDAHHIVWMGGGTAGYRAFLGFDAKARAGVVVLANVCNISGNLSGFDDVDHIGLDLLDERFVDYR
jgi:D-alanyl-D-alanine-carboxypeptidase/D-alanyl-D-alanine-endopeptidase